MAVLYCPNLVHDCNLFAADTSRNDAVSTGIDLSRVAYGFTATEDNPYECNWYEPAGNTVWFHFWSKTSSNNINFDDEDAFSFYDVDGNLVLSHGWRDGDTRWTLFGDTEAQFQRDTYKYTPILWDAAFTKNGTTDLSLELYRNGIFVQAMTVANTADNGVPVRMKFLTESSSSGSATIYTSEWIIADEPTVGWRLYQNRPVARGLARDWDFGTGDGMVTDSLEEVHRSNTVDARTDFGLANFENIATDATIDRMFVVTRALRGAAGNVQEINHYWRYPAPSTVIEDGANITLTENIDYYTEEFTTSPDTTLGWSKDELHGMQLGIRARA